MLIVLPVVFSGLHQFLINWLSGECQLDINR
jgi:hypothetical protein